MTRLAPSQDGRVDDPIPISSFPFADTIDVSATHSGPDEPSPCLPSATATWYALQLDRTARLIVDLAGSTPLDPVVRLYRPKAGGSLTFVGCASPVWNAQLSLEVSVAEGETLLAQVGTSESLDGRLVFRAELRA